MYLLRSLKKLKETTKTTSNIFHHFSIFPKKPRFLFLNISVFSEKVGKEDPSSSPPGKRWRQDSVHGGLGPKPPHLGLWVGWHHLGSWKVEQRTVGLKVGGSLNVFGDFFLVGFEISLIFFEFWLNPHFLSHLLLGNHW